jgi:hypothetical protein
MNKFCLTIEEKRKFREALRNGEITPEIIAELKTSASRRAFLAKYVGGAKAPEVNALLEKGMLLKNQKAGLISAIKKTLGMTPEVKRDFLSKVERLNQALEDSELDQFLQDFYSKALKMPGLTETQWDTISELSSKITELSKGFDPKTET